MNPDDHTASSIEKKIDELLSRMTLNEKIAQMLSMCGWTMYVREGNQIRVSEELVKLYKTFPGAGLGSFNRADWYTGKNWENGLTPELTAKAHNMIQRYAVEETRLGIPLLFGGSIHGLFVLGGVVFPTGLGFASTWDRGLVRQAGADVVSELSSFCRAGFAAGPTQDLARDPRWSRVEETYGEDPWLSAELTAAYNHGILSAGKGFAPSIRHFTGHGEPEGGHNGAPAHTGKNELFNIHMRPFEAGVKSGALSTMSAYNLIDGIPCSIHGELINGVLRDRWNYRGYITADAFAITMLVETGFAKDLGEAAALAVKNGTDVCCWEGENFLKGIQDALTRGLLTEADLDVHVRRMLRLKFESGVFEHPYVEDESAPVRILGCPAHRETALHLARESLILLSNPRGLLPLKQPGKIAVVGPNADNIGNQLGDYTSPQKREAVITVRKGFEMLANQLHFKVGYASGCKVRSMDVSGFAEAEKTVREADAAVVVLGGSSTPDMETEFMETGAALAQRCREDSNQDKDSGEGYDRAKLRLGGVQLELLKRLLSTGKPVITVLIMGRPLVLDEVLEYSDAVICAWYPGMMGGLAVAEAVLGLYNPGGKLPVSIPRSEGQLPVYYNALQKRKNYVDTPGEPLLRFGFGLSYTNFQYSEMTLEKTVCRADEPNRATVKVTNAGTTAGDEVVQMYVTDVQFSVARPELELRGFERIHLLPGESRVVEFPITESELGFYGADLEYRVEPGLFRIHVGGNLDSLLTLDLEVSE